MPTQCPRDGTVLTPTRDVFGPGVEAQVCRKCAGVMADWKTAQPFFSRLGITLADLQSLVKRGVPGKRSQPVPCTSCGKGAMHQLVVDGVELDLCEACGAAWFDRGELARVSKGQLGALPAAPAPVRGERSEVVAVYEMLWDCAFCDATALLGKSNRFCPKCGAPQDPDRRYFPPEGQEVQANTEFEGADRRCPACATPSGAKANNCRNCGSPLDGSAEVARVADRSSAAPVMPVAGAGKVASSGGGRRWLILGGVAAAVACGVCSAAVLWKKEVGVTVTGHRWERTIEVEELRAVRDDAWCDSMPSGAYSVSRSREQRSTNRVQDGEECSTRDVDRGDGTFERRRECRPTYREEPVYDDKCHFTIDRWQTARTARAEGQGVSPAPEWPAVELSRRGAGLGAQREGSRREAYTLELRGDDGKDYSCEVSAERWRGIEDGLTRPIKVGVMTGAADCDGL